MMKDPIELDYTKRGWWYNVKTWLNSLPSDHGTKSKILIDITLKPRELGGEPRFHREEHIVWMLEDRIAAMGYCSARGFAHHSMVWAFSKEYARINNGRCFDVAVPGPTPGTWTYPQDTSYTLKDYLDSKSYEAFRSTMGKVRAVGDLDLQKIAMIGILIVGVIAGLFILGGHRCRWKSSRRWTRVSITSPRPRAATSKSWPTSPILPR